jgi:hypothetical protein
MSSIITTLLANPTLIIVVVLFFLIRSDSANPLVETLINLLRSLTKTPAATVEGHDLSNDTGRFCCAKHLAEEFAKRGQTDVADKIRTAMHVLIDEGVKA